MEEIHFSHKPVLLRECIDGLQIKPDGIYVDGTAGGAGHSSVIASHLTTGKLIALDQDEDAVRVATQRLAPFGDRAVVIRENFCHVGEVLADLGIDAVDGMLLDLGVSSYQLDTAERGFSYMADAPLDMRMDNRVAFSARDVVNTYPESKLKEIIYNYGEDKFAPAIARGISEARKTAPIETTGQLVEIIKRAVPGFALAGPHHPAKRTFQAIRIEVNHELDVIEPAIRACAQVLRPGGRMAVITFHSLEDRLTKTVFADLATGCTCPRNLPVCVCGRKPVVKLITRKPVLPTEDELENNPRSRSAKLRVAEKL